jgi:DNA-binding response OmpR family regulator
MRACILAIDDDPEVTHSLRRFLEVHGYDVREENDSTHALQTARTVHPGVVILDFLMPKVHGGDVAWQLASDRELQDVPVILCSAASEEELHSKLPPTRAPKNENP